MILAPINETLPATGAGAAKISLGAAQDCEDYAIQARGAVDMKISNVEELTTYFTVKANSSQSLNEALGKGAAFFWAESKSTEDTVEILPLRRHRNR